MPKSVVLVFFLWFATLLKAGSGSNIKQFVDKRKTIWPKLSHVSFELYDFQARLEDFLVETEKN